MKGKTKRITEMDRRDVTYLVQVNESGPIKIGFSSTFNQRLKSLRAGSGYPIYTRLLVDGNCETQLHIHFNEFRLHGEWFMYSRPIHEFVCSQYRVMPRMLNEKNGFGVMVNRVNCECGMCYICGFQREAYWSGADRFFQKQAVRQENGKS